MSSWTHGAQANEMSHFSPTRTLSDFPLLIGEMLRTQSSQPRRLPEGGIFVPETAVRAPDQFDARRRDYCLWLRLVHRRVSDR
jgi:hypothetical protein